jgi:hypothetical protein
MPASSWPSVTPLVTRDVAMPDPTETAASGFATDPRAWLDWLRGELRAGRWEVALAATLPASWQNDAGHSWRIVRTPEGIEVRPALESPFIQLGESLKVTALALTPDHVSVELTCRTGRWVDRFPLDAFDIAELGRAMLAERSLPHDNLALLFPVR